MKQRLDQVVLAHGLAPTRSQAENWIRLGEVTVNGRIVTKPGYFVDDTAIIKMTAQEQYVSRAGLKLASVAALLGANFTDRVVLMLALQREDSQITHCNTAHAR